MGRGTFSGAQMALLRQSIPSIVDFQLYFQKRDFDFFFSYLFDFSRLAGRSEVSLALKRRPCIDI